MCNALHGTCYMLSCHGIGQLYILGVAQKGVFLPLILDGTLSVPTLLLLLCCCFTSTVNI